MRAVLLVTAIAFATLTSAAAQDFTAAQREACKGDYDKYCKGTMPGGGRILACLGKQRDQLSAACKQVIDSQKK